MSTDAPAPAARLRGGTAALLLLALALRLWDIGNPVIHPDEQYYLLVGERLAQSALPYVDLWDRKPIGLFLLYAVFAALPGDAIIGYQSAALLAAIATALVTRAAARRAGASDLGAVAAGAVYLLGLALLGGRGGQAPVFYDLPVALAGWLTLRLPELAAARRRGAIAASGAAVAALGGAAIQLKYTAAIEAAFFGAVHLWAWHRAGGARATILPLAALLGTLGLLPTAVAGLWYHAHGAGGAWWFANFASIALRPGYPAGQIAMRLLGIGAQLAPLALAATIAWRTRPRSGIAGDTRRIAFGWLAAALAGFVAIGTFFDHYALPLLAPLAVAAAPALGRITRLLVATLALAAMLVVVERLVLPAHEGEDARALARVVAANDAGGCPYVFIGDTITYHLADACLPTAYAFPNLLAYSTERGATGIDEAAEVRRILAARPPVIVTSTRRLSIWNAASLAAVKAALFRDYRLIYTAPRASWRSAVYLRRDRRFVSPDGMPIPR